LQGVILSEAEIIEIAALPEAELPEGELAGGCGGRVRSRHGRRDGAEIRQNDEKIGKSDYLPYALLRLASRLPDLPQKIVP
jgi:hypothetical protein